MIHKLFFIFKLVLFFVFLENNAQANDGSMRIPDSTYHEADSGVIFDVVEMMPEYPGGFKALNDFLLDSINLPEDCSEGEMVHKMYYTFIIEKDGRMTHIKKIKSLNCEQLNSEIVRVLKLCSVWQPGIQSGQKVRVRINIPVLIHLK